MELFKNILISFSNFFLSIPFTIGNLSKFSKSDIKAHWQPPGYIFGIVWPVLYLIFGIINLKTIYSKNITNKIKNLIVGQSLIEAFLQILWLTVTSNYGYRRLSSQYIAGFIPMIGLLYYAYMVRLPSFKKYDYTLYYMYIPYTIWITFASILNYQLILKSINL